jgi:hypothetical protein
VTSVVIGCGLGGVSCAEGPDANLSRAACEVEGRSAAQIKLQTSGLSCAEAGPIVLIMNSSVGLHTVTAPGAADKGQFRVRWSCRLFPIPSYPLEVRCAHGERHFTVVALPKE